MYWLENLPEGKVGSHHKGEKDILIQFSLPGLTLPIWRVSTNGEAAGLWSREDMRPKKEMLGETAGGNSKISILHIICARLPTPGQPSAISSNVVQSIPFALKIPAAPETSYLFPPSPGSRGPTILLRQETRAL